jgi:hypothetical protein
MRKDMSKVIVERPRVGSRGVRMHPGRTRAVVDDDGAPLPVREPAGRERRTKHLNENLSPLKRYLARQVGRPWNKVYAEISEHLKATSTVQQHVRDHLQDFVASTTRMADGKVMTAGRYAGGEMALDEDRREYFVHPRTGLLRRNPAALKARQSLRKWKAERAAEHAARRRRISAKRQLLKRDESWWEVKFVALSQAEAPDVLLGAEASPWQREFHYGRADLHAVSMRLLSKAELKKHGLG